MEKKYKNLIFICLCIVVGIELVFFTNLFLSSKKGKNNEESIETKLRSEVNRKNKEVKTNDNKKEVDEKRNNLEKTITYTKNEEANTKEENNSSAGIENRNNKDIETIDQKENYNVDDEVINYLEMEAAEVNENIKEKNYKEKAKNTFIEIIDFLFYGGTIKNHTFNEMTGKAKLEAIKIAIKIEDKIEQYQPGMIEEIDSKYRNIKSKIINLYTNKVNEYCNNHSNLCENVKSDYDKMKNSFRNAFNISKNKLSTFYNEKIKNN